MPKLRPGARAQSLCLTEEKVLSMRARRQYIGGKRKRRPGMPVIGRCVVENDRFTERLVTLTGRSTLASCRGLESGLKLSEYRSPLRWRSKMDASQFGHEGLPHLRAAFFEKLRADR